MDSNPQWCLKFYENKLIVILNTTLEYSCYIKPYFPFWLWLNAWLSWWPLYFRCISNCDPINSNLRWLISSVGINYTFHVSITSKYIDTCLFRHKLAVLSLHNWYNYNHRWLRYHQSCNKLNHNKSLKHVWYQSGGRHISSDS